MRPTSPHLSIYKKQISSVSSAFHRISGAGLFGAISLLSWWFIACIFLKMNPLILSVFDYKLVKLAVFGSSVAAFYHLSTGIRHLIWDIGFGFSIPSINKGGWIAIFGCIILTLIFWLYIV
jgi:succinate dehydrogenase / fumarate reductase cytochrome b subunit